MGFHVCEYCRNATSSGDTTLAFDGGQSWEMPDMILHYIAVHKWRPPEGFIFDVLNRAVVNTHRADYKCLPIKVGYLSGPLDSQRLHNIHDLPSAFFMKLWILLQDAKLAVGARKQTRGVHL